MKLLVIIPRSAEIHIALYNVSESASWNPEHLASGYSEGGVAAARTSLRSFLSNHGAPDAIAFYTPVAGIDLPDSTPVDAELLRTLEERVGRAPLHLPALISAIEASQRECPGIPSTLVTGSSFFADLPAAERAYAVEAASPGKDPLERTGHHGLFHEAAAALAEESVVAAAPLRVLSLCLEPRPEAVAMVGRSPKLVTGGATPLEGLPGQTTCGELDPGMILILAQEQRLGPEEIGRILTRESGLQGLVGKPTTLTEVFSSDIPEAQLARDIMLYRLLQVAGSALAALGGLDAIVFSGRHARTAEVIGPWLLNRLGRVHGKPRPCILTLRATLEELIVGRALKSLNEAHRLSC